MAAPLYWAPLSETQQMMNLTMQHWGTHQPAAEASSHPVGAFDFNRICFYWGLREGLRRCATSARHVLGALRAETPRQPTPLRASAGRRSLPRARCRWGALACDCRWGLTAGTRVAKERDRLADLGPESRGAAP
eukprot:866623-Prymnesium_polylepis.1